MIQINAFMQLSEGEDEFTKWFLNHDCAAVRLSNCAAGLKCLRPALTKRCLGKRAGIIKISCSFLL
jgi:hypothetical protein